jgi:hypothetical protein
VSDVHVHSLVKLHAALQNWQRRRSQAPWQRTGNDCGCCGIQQSAHAQAQCSCQGDVAPGVARLLGSIGNHVKANIPASVQRMAYRAMNRVSEQMPLGNEQGE